ncbi:MAG: helix-turn-helix domain-containing protein [Oscillospiraceae bacterium]|nr:helix-turn-helix domain-containing protein [Oscillospiraceae bacterium]
MTQKEYAKYLGVPFGTLQQWEQDRVSISKGTWESLNRFGG